MGTLGIPVEEILTPLFATYADILTSDTSTRSFDRASTAYGTLLYRSIQMYRTRVFGVQL